MADPMSDARLAEIGDQIRRLPGWYGTNSLGLARQLHAELTCVRGRLAEAVADRDRLRAENEQRGREIEELRAMLEGP